MSGVNEMEQKYRNKIKNVIADSETLKHYVNFINSPSFMTKYAYTCIVAAFLKHINKLETDLTFDDFNDYLSDIQYLDNNEKKTSSYMITVYSALKKFCEYLFVSKRIRENYMQYIKRPKAVERQSTTQKRKNGFLTEKEIHKLVGHINYDPSSKRTLSDEWKLRNCAIIYLFLYTGMRCSALVSIDVDDIDFENNILIVTDKESKVHEYSLTNDLCNILKDWIRERDKMNISNNALFVSNRKQRISTQTVALMVKTYSQMSGITNKNITPHKLRATYGTQLYNKTGDIYFVQNCMGHQSPATTQLYIRGDMKNSKRAADIMESII